MKKLLFLIVLAAGVLHAVEVPFTPFANVAKDVTIQPQEAKNKFGATDYLEFPAMPKKPGMTAVLKLNQRIAQDRHAGWFCQHQIHQSLARGRL